MAAVTFTQGPNYIVIGNRRMITGIFNTAGAADTFATGLNYISSAQATENTNAAIGLTKSGATITFVTAGATTANQLVVVGI